MVKKSRQVVISLVIHSFIHSFFHSLIHSFNHSFIHHAFIHSLTHSFIFSFILSFKHSLVLLITHIFATLKMWMKLAWVRFREDFCDSDDVQGKNWSITVMIPETIIIEGHILAPVPFSFLKRIYSFIYSHVFILHNKRFMSQAGQTWHFAQSTRRVEEKQIKRLLPVYCSGSSAHLHPQLTDGSDVKRTKQANVIRAPQATMQKYCTAKNQFSLNRNNLPKDLKTSNYCKQETSLHFVTKLRKTNVTYSVLSLIFPSR